VFERLAEAPAASETLAATLGLLPRGLDLLLKALVSLGYLRRAEDGTFALEDASAALLLRGRPGSMAHILRHSNHLFQSWASLETLLRDGPSVSDADKATLQDPETNRNFILGMAEASGARAGSVIAALPLAGARRMLDVGGGPGHYACEAVRQHPGLQAEVVDLALTVAVAREYIQGQGLQDRVGTRVADFYRCADLDLGEPADLIFVSQVLHAEGPAENQSLLTALARHLVPGGWLVIHENLVDDDGCAPAAAAVFAVNMLVGTERGRTYSATEIAAWLSGAGLGELQTMDLGPRSGLVLARRPLTA